VTYPDEAQALQGLIDGTVGFALAAPAQVAPHVEAGRLTALGVTGVQRLAPLQQVRTLSEQGFTALPGGNWIGFVAPSGLPRNVAERLSQALRESLRAPDVRERIERAGFVVSALPPDAFAARVRGDLHRARDAVRRGGGVPQ
jgi:tripartite-type tricarboxylate transporter receptor subunit TctC